MNDYFYSFEYLTWPVLVGMVNWTWYVNVIGDIANEENQ